MWVPLQLVNKGGGNSVKTDRVSYHVEENFALDHAHRPGFHPRCVSQLTKRRELSQWVHACVYMMMMMEMMEFGV